VANQGLDAAQAFRQRHQADAVADAARRLERSHVERDHAPEPAHLAFRQIVLRV
jgi:hypothetical protein